MVVFYELVKALIDVTPSNFDHLNCGYSVQVAR